MADMCMMKGRCIQIVDVPKGCGVCILPAVEYGHAFRVCVQEIKESEVKIEQETRASVGLTPPPTPERDGDDGLEEGDIVEDEVSEGVEGRDKGVVKTDKEAGKGGKADDKEGSSATDSECLRAAGAQRVSLSESPSTPAARRERARAAKEEVEDVQDEARNVFSQRTANALGLRPVRPAGGTSERKQEGVGSLPTPPRAPSSRKAGTGSEGKAATCTGASGRPGSKLRFGDPTGAVPRGLGRGGRIRPVHPQWSGPQRPAKRYASGASYPHARG